MSGNPRFEVVCACGRDEFEFLHHGEGSGEEPNRNPPASHSIQYHGEWFVIESRCVNCGKQHVLFDNQLHGYDALMGELPRATTNRPSLVEWICRRCGGSGHRIVLEFELPDEEEVRGIAEDEPSLGVDPEKWRDAFYWFYVHLTCLKCDLKTEELVSYECA